MTHDIDDIHIALIEEHLDYALRMIKKLEERIITLEKELGNTLVINPTDSWYWEHG